MRQIYFKYMFTILRWVARVTTISAIGMLSAVNYSVYASESHEEACSNGLNDLIKKEHLNPSEKTVNKAIRLCLNFEESKARKLLRKSPRIKTKVLRNEMGRCLEIAGGINANRTNVQIFDCNNTKSQIWVYTSKKEIRNVMGRCLEIAGGINANRTNVQIFDCNNTKSQKWVYNSRKEIRNVMGRCLDVAGGVNANRTNVQIFDCNGTKSQKW